MINAIVLSGAKLALALSTAFHGGVVSPAPVEPAGSAARAEYGEIADLQPQLQRESESIIQGAMRADEFADRSSAVQPFLIAGVLRTVVEPEAAAPYATSTALVV